MDKKFFEKNNLICAFDFTTLNVNININTQYSP